MDNSTTCVHLRSELYFHSIEQTNMGTSCEVILSFFCERTHFLSQNDCIQPTYYIRKQSSLTMFYKIVILLYKQNQQPDIKRELFI